MKYQITIGFEVVTKELKISFIKDWSFTIKMIKPIFKVGE